MRSERLTLLSLGVVALLLIAAPLAAAEPAEPAAEPMPQESDAPMADERPDEEVRGSVSLGYWDSSIDGDPSIMNKYEPIGDNVDVRLDYTNLQEWGLLSLGARFRDGDDQDYSLGIEGGRTYRGSFDYQQFVNRMIHDDLDNLEAVTNHGRVTWHTDLDPQTIYGEDWKWLEHRSELQFPGFANLTLGVNYRLQERDGVHQALTVSHCSTCHVYGQDRPIGEETEDVSLDVTYDFANAQLKASWLSRELRQDVRSITLLFDDALQPELRVPIFDDRLQFDSAEGPQPVHQRPDIDKEIGKLGLLFPSAGKFHIDVTGVTSSTENLVAGLESDYGGYVLNVTRPLGEKWRLRWRNRYYSLDNDTAIVAINERRSIAGPLKGRTYAETFGFPDQNPYLRFSALDRDVLESWLEASWRLSKEAGTIRFFWDYNDTDREYSFVAPGDTQTTENVFGAAWSSRPTKRLRLWAKARYGDVDNPYMALDGQYSTLFSGPAGGALDPNATQYYEWQNARVADGTALAESWIELDLRGSYRFGQATMVSASYRYWDGDNDSLDLTDWERSNDAFTVSLFSSPDERTSWYVSYAYNGSETKLPNTIPIFDG